MEGAPTDAQHLRDLHSGISLRLQYGIPYPTLSSGKVNPKAPSVKASIQSTRGYYENPNYKWHFDKFRVFTVADYGGATHNRRIKRPKLSEWIAAEINLIRCTFLSPKFVTSQCGHQAGAKRNGPHINKQHGSMWFIPLCGSRTPSTLMCLIVYLMPCMVNYRLP